MEQTASTIDIGAMRNLLNGLILLQNHLRLYGPKNANVTLTTERLLGFLSRLFSEQATVTIYVARHAFMVDDHLLDRNNQNFEKFAGCLFAHGIAAVNLQQGLTAFDLHTFLQLTSRKPAETWDEGGMANCLATREVTHVAVREMAEQDFLLFDTLSEVPAELLQHQRSRLWENFALSLLHGLQLPDPDPRHPEQWSPTGLAEQLNTLLASSGEADQQVVTRDASRFLISLKHERIRIYRAAALYHLAAFVNNLSPTLRRMFLNHAFALNLDADLAESFLKGLSNQVILEALQQAASGKSYVPPVALKLLGRLAKERGMAEQSDLSVGSANPDAVPEKVRELFKGDDFDKYVPKAYQGALMAIIHKESLPVTTTAALEQLKATLEPKALEQHLGEIIFDILDQGPDEKHIDALCSNLHNSLRFYSGVRDYTQIGKIIGRCQDPQGHARLLREAEAFLSARDFTAVAIDDLLRLPQQQADALWELMLALPAPFVEPLLERLGTENSRSARILLLKGLGRFGQTSIGPAIARLADHRWFVVRNMLYLLRELGAHECLPEIRKALQHPHPKVKMEALRTCLVFRDERAVPHLLQALEAKDPLELISSINLASLSSHRQVLARLLELLTGGSLLDYQVEVKKAVVRALANNARELCLPIFSELLTTRNLLHARAHEQLKLEVIALLGKFPSGEAKALLEDQLRTGSTELARAAQLSLNKLAGATL